MHSQWTVAHRVLAVIVIVALPALLVVPFHPEAWLLGDAESSTPWHLHPEVYALVEWGGNIAAFAGFSIALSAFIRRLPVVFVIGSAASASLELVQTVVPGRFASLSDFVLNSFGALVGVLLVAFARRLIVLASSRRRRLQVGEA